MKTYNKVCKDIKRIQAKLKTKPVTENFGEEEAQKLREKYNILSMTDLLFDEREACFYALLRFENWCTSYTGK